MSQTATTVRTQPVGLKQAQGELRMTASERREHEAEKRYEKAQEKARKKQERKCGNAKNGENGTHTNFHFLSVTQHGHVVMHVANNQLAPFKMHSCPCDECKKPYGSPQEFVKSYGVHKFEIITVEDHPNDFVVLIDGQPQKIGFNIYPVGLDTVISPKCGKPISQKIWKVAEHIRRRKGF